MKNLFTAILVMLIGGGTLLAEPPAKKSLWKYRKLWEQSLVTKKPVIEEEKVEEVSELDDYALGGYSKTPQGYFVSLINTKDPKERLTIGPGIPGSQSYEVLKVKADPLNFTKAEVLIKAGGKQKWIAYDEKSLTIRQPAARPASNRPNNNRAANQNQNQQQNNRNANNPAAANSNATKRQPRVRRVPVPPKK